MNDVRLYREIVANEFRRSCIVSKNAADSRSGKDYNLRFRLCNESGDRLFVTKLQCLMRAGDHVDISSPAKRTHER
jgi:hypothetical protein